MIKKSKKQTVKGYNIGDQVVLIGEQAGDVIEIQAFSADELRVIGRFMSDDCVGDVEFSELGEQV